ncbi:MAG: helix-turn-helix domain-containing protein [Sediminibacterium sp.]
MGIDIVTKDDLLVFRNNLLADLKAVISEVVQKIPESPEGYKTKHVRAILGCSVNKLVALRISRKIRVKKVGGTLYYNKDDVKKLVQEGY